MPRKALTRGKLHSLQDIGCSSTVVQLLKRSTQKYHVDIPTPLHMVDSTVMCCHLSLSRNFKVYSKSSVVWFSILYFHFITEMRPYEASLDVPNSYGTNSR